MTILGDRLRQLRSSQNLTVREFADRIGKSPGYVSRIETRDEVPNAELLCSIAEIYGISPEELLSLAKDSQLTRTSSDLDKKYQAALALYRKAGK